MNSSDIINIEEEGVKMARIGRKRKKIKLNEVLNNRLDAMEDTSSMDAFMPKKDISMNLMNLVNESIENDTGKKRQNANGSGIGTSIGIAIIIILFFFFVFLMYSVIF